MALFTQLPTVIRPKDDDRVVGIGACLERVEEPPHKRVGKRDGREVALDRAFPLTGFDDVVVVIAAPSDDFFCAFPQIV